MSINTSGLYSASLRQSVTGNNIANMNTPGFQASRVNQSASATGGVQIDSIQKLPNSDPNSSGTDLAASMVDMIQNQKTTGFNVAAIKTQDEMLGEVIDLKA